MIVCIATFCCQALILLGYFGLTWLCKKHDKWIVSTWRCYLTARMQFYVNFIIAEFSLKAEAHWPTAYKTLIEYLIHVFEINCEINLKLLLWLIRANAYVCACNHICFLLEGIKSFHLFIVIVSSLCIWILFYIECQGLFL